MFGTTGLSIIAIVSGVLLALMININSELAAATSAVQSSWLAHGIGCVLAALLCVIFNNKAVNKRELQGENQSNKITQLRSYLGGIPGSFTVVLASLTVQSEIGLTGTLALALIGQFIFSLLVEHFGLLNQKVNKLSFLNVLPSVFVIVGSILIIYGKASV